MPDAVAERSSPVAVHPPAGCDCLTHRIAESTTPVMAVDGEGGIVAANDFGVGLRISSSDTLVGVRLHDLFPAQYADPTLVIVRQVLADGVPRTANLMWRGYWIRARYARVRSAAGHYLCLAGIDPWRQPVFESSRPADVHLGEFPAHDLGDLASLSAREAEVLWMIGQGMSIPAVARALARSTKTIESHVRSIGTKLKVRGRFEMGLLAQERALTLMTADQVRRIFSEKNGR